MVGPHRHLVVSVQTESGRYRRGTKDFCASRIVMIIARATMSGLHRFWEPLEYRTEIDGTTDYCPRRRSFGFTTTTAHGESHTTNSTTEETYASLPQRLSQREIEYSVTTEYFFFHFAIVKIFYFSLFFFSSSGERFQYDGCHSAPSTLYKDELTRNVNDSICCVICGAHGAASGKKSNQSAFLQLDLAPRTRPWMSGQPCHSRSTAAFS